MEQSNRFGYRRLRRLHLAAAAVTAAAAVLIAWLSLHHNKTLSDMWLILGLLGLGAAAFGYAGVYVGSSSVVLGDDQVAERRPLRAERVIPWSDVARVVRFESERQTDIVPASGGRALTIIDDIDRFKELQLALATRAAARYSVQKSRPRRYPAWLPVAAGAGVVAAAFLATEFVLPGRVTVVVTDANGAPLPGATVFFFNKQYPQGQWRTGPDGRVEKRLPAAPYGFAVGAPGHKGHQAKVEVVRFSAQTFAVRLERK